MPGRCSDAVADAVVGSSERQGAVYCVQHGLVTHLPARISISVRWANGNRLRIAFFKKPTPREEEEEEEEEEETTSAGKVVELRLGSTEIDDAEKRRISYASVSVFALLQSHKQVMMRSKAPFSLEWWEHVMEFSRSISTILGSAREVSSLAGQNTAMLKQESQEPILLKAIWDLLEIFDVDKQSLSWLPERLVDWLATYDRVLSRTEMTVHSRLVAIQVKLCKLKTLEDDPDYWDGVASALALGWLDVAVDFLRMHGSYQLDQLDNRQTENGLVEAVAVLISKMPRMRPSLPASGLGQCFNLKPDFIKAWEKWRGQVAKLDCSAFWNECDHHETMCGLKKLIRIMLGDIETLAFVTCHWMELSISHLLYIRPFAMAMEGMLSLSKKCIQLKSPAANKQLTSLILGIIGDDIEVVLAECSQIFDPWMLSHMIELLMAKSFQAESLLRDEKYNLGGISLEELHRLVYAQVLSSHSFTWQIAPIYLASCPRQGLGLLEILLLKQPYAGDSRLALKGLEICRLYELDAVGKSIMQIVGMHHWKHGRKGAGIFWLQKARDENRLNAIAEHLLGFVGKSVLDDAFQQWEGLIDLLGSEHKASGGLAFLHKYRDFKKALQFVQDVRSNEINNQKFTAAARQAVNSLIEVAETRFALHTLDLRRLVKVRGALSGMVINDLWGIWRQTNTKRARNVKALILDDTWWDCVEYLLSFTEPIVSMLRFFDMDHPCMGEIYDGIDSMIELIKSIINAKEQDPTETFFKEVQSHLIERWNKMTTSLHLLAFALTPKYYSAEILSFPRRVPPSINVEVSEGYKVAFSRLFPDPKVEDLVRSEFVNFISSRDHSITALRDKYKMDAYSWRYLHGQAYTHLMPLAIKVLSQLMKNPSTPQWFWIFLLHDSVDLLQWSDHALVNVAETNMLLNKLQELSLAKVRGESEPSKSDSSPQVLQQVRLALASNLGRAMLLE